MATPIGNLGDISQRAIDTLNSVGLIVCEDTRVTAKLLKAHGIAGRRKSYHDHNAAAMRPRLIEQLLRGESVALVTDAGTPLMSDPGLKLVQAAISADIPVTTAPGPMAAIAALTLAGLPTDRFLFAGFLPTRKSARRATLRELAAVPSTLIFYESNRRLAAALADMAMILGQRPAAVARELTKLHEEVVRGTLDNLHDRFAEHPVRGEIVVVVGPPTETTEDVGPEATDALLRDALQRYSVRDAVAVVAAETGHPRRTLYARALRLRDS